MGEVIEHVPGTFCWAEAGTTDVPAAKHFYGEVLGWGFLDVPMGEQGMYSMAQVQGHNVSALFPQQPEMRANGVPPSWLCYVAVKGVDDVAARAEALGAKLTVPPMDVMTAGRMAILEDPTGAALALWQPKMHMGAALLNDAGAMGWHELLTGDPERAAAFYKELFGWEPTPSHLPGMDYTTFRQGDRQVAGLMKLEASMGPRPHWMLYFTVDDCDAAVGRAEQGGGKILAPALDIPTVGRIATIQDPQGAAFAVVAFARPSA